MLLKRFNNVVVLTGTLSEQHAEEAKVIEVMKIESTSKYFFIQILRLRGDHQHNV